MDNFLYPMFKTGSGDNKASYSNPDVDKGLEDARGIPDSAERIAAYKEVDKLIDQLEKRLELIKNWR